MIPTRIRLSAVLLAAAAATTAAGAQTYSFSRTELGRVVPARFATTTQQLLASVDVASSATVIAEEAPAVTRTDLLSDMLSDDMQSPAAADEKDAKDEESFFSSSMGRASLVGLAGLAGASYFALRPDNAAANELSYTLGKGTDPVTQGAPIGGIAANLPAPTALIVNPEPGTFGLLALGLGVVGFAARRRRVS
ncbi:MAG: PEP-CTERM sorting domain-containing protein [Gemmatimonadaceae bacterium]|nr:PEP-CTERM sorting domain-containing protein [Gemmatimonadaceae bacterium]